MEVSERRGRPRKSEESRELQKRIRELEKRNKHLEKELDKAATISDVQKKLCDLLGLNAEPENGNNT